VWAGIVDGRLMAIMFYGHEFAAAIALILLYESFNMCLFTWFRHDGAAHSSAASQNYHSPQIGHGYEAIFPGQHEHLTWTIFFLNYGLHAMVSYATTAFTRMELPWPFESLRWFLTYN
jgi:hypothetical protein